MEPLYLAGLGPPAGLALKNAIAGSPWPTTIIEWMAILGLLALGGAVPLINEAGEAAVYAGMASGAALGTLVGPVLLWWKDF